MSIEVIQSHSFQVGDVTVSFTIGRIGRSNISVEAGASIGPEAGDATPNKAPEAKAQGGNPVCANASHSGVTGGESAAQVSSQDAEVVTPLVHAKPAPAESLGDKISAPTPKPKLSKAEQIRTLRPNCRHADDLDKCAGVGRKHCRGCAAAVETEAA